MIVTGGVLFDLEFYFYDFMLYLIYGSSRIMEISFSFYLCMIVFGWVMFDVKFILLEIWAKVYDYMLLVANKSCRIMEIVFFL